MNQSLPFDISVLIGRFQPFHLGHAALLAKALETAPQVVVVLGSSLRARNAKNPFTWKERAAMILETLDPEKRSRVHFIPIRDYYDHVIWAEVVRRTVQSALQNTDRVALIGHCKDHSSYYLTLFPDWTFVEAGQQGSFEATELRRLCYEGGATGLAKALESLPASLRGTFQAWVESPEFAGMQEEHLAIQESRKTWGQGPFITLDAVEFCAGHVLLVRRGRCPGKGLWAIPGGFLELTERLLDGALRELQEETGLALKTHPRTYELKQVVVFDHPDRSQRGRTITHAHCFQLSGTALPEVAGADDAAEAKWIPVSDISAMEDQFFEDHFHILQRFL